MQGSTEGGGSPHTIRWPAMIQHWEQAAFLHWRYPVEEVQALLPPGLTVDGYQGEAWVGLVPFFVRARPPLLPGIPPLTHFPETNVRTYVVGPGSDPGVWFFSLDTTRLAGMLIGRTVYRVPYHWSRMSVERRDRIVTYSARRRTRPRGASSLVRVRVGERYRPGEAEELELFLIARFTMFGAWGDRLLVARANHPPWPLHHATAEWEDELVAAAGLTAPREPPLVHWSPGVRARIGFPVPVPPPRV